MNGGDAVGLLATTAGIAGVVGVLMNVLRRSFTDAGFDRWAPIVAVVFGIILAVAFAVVTANPLTGNILLGAVVIGILGGALSQNINTVIQRTMPS